MKEDICSRCGLHKERSLNEIEILTDRVKELKKLRKHNSDTYDDVLDAIAIICDSLSDLTSIVIHRCKESDLDER